MCHKRKVRSLLCSVIQAARLMEALLSSKHVISGLASALIFSRQMEKEKEERLALVLWTWP